MICARTTQRHKANLEVLAKHQPLNSPPFAISPWILAVLSPDKRHENTNKATNFGMDLAAGDLALVSYDSRRSSEWEALPTSQWVSHLQPT